MKNRLVINTGFALFSMFFGSGNLVFPLVIGQQSGESYFLAALGIILTGVVVPFLGVFGMMLYQGNFERFFSYFGKRGIFMFSLLSLALMGPFGVLARCLTVVHGALQPIFPNASLVGTGLCMCAVIYFMANNKNKIVTILGTFLTPFLLLSIAAIAFFGLKEGISQEAATSSSWEVFTNGFFQGYQTMDLLAAFFFSTFVIGHLKSTANEGVSSNRIFIPASFIGAGCLSLVYLVLVLLGRAYAPLLEHAPPQEMLGRVAVVALGSMAAPCVCVAVILACLTTAIVLASLFADFLRKSVLQEKIGNKCSLFITLAIGFFVSTLEFEGIARFLGPILETIYPALIVLTAVNIARNTLEARRARKELAPLI